MGSVCGLAASGVCRGGWKGACRDPALARHCMPLQCSACLPSTPSPCRSCLRWTPLCSGCTGRHWMCWSSTCHLAQVGTDGGKVGFAGMAAGHEKGIDSMRNALGCLSPCCRCWCRRRAAEHKPAAESVGRRHRFNSTGEPPRKACARTLRATVAAPGQMHCWLTTLSGLLNPASPCLALLVLLRSSLPRRTLRCWMPAAGAPCSAKSTSQSSVSGRVGVVVGGWAW